MKQRRTIILTAIALILLTPLVAMFFTDEINWNLTDFIVAGFLLLGTFFIFELITSKMSSTKNKIIAGIIILLTLILIWIELAVGVFGSPWAGS